MPVHVTRQQVTAEEEQLQYSTQLGLLSKQQAEVVRHHV